MVALEQTWWIRCERSGDAGITCVSMGGPTPAAAEECARANEWISLDGYHECPSHPRKEAPGQD